ncbi:hypothetical protein L1887_48989 [Cichorium endivia]|nr:hypothetical protein L1887_48989 [Cichorium endivia]
MLLFALGMLYGKNPFRRRRRPTRWRRDNALSAVNKWQSLISSLVPSHCLPMRTRYTNPTSAEGIAVVKVCSVNRGNGRVEARSSQGTDRQEGQASRGQQSQSCTAIASKHDARLELGRRTKALLGRRQIRVAGPVERLCNHLVAPPIDGQRAVLGQRQRKEHHNGRDDRAAVHGGGEDKVVLGPPAEVVLAHEVLEDESHRKPRRVVDPTRRRDERHTGKDDRPADVSDPAPGIPPRGQPERNRDQGSHQHRPVHRPVDRVVAKHPRRPDRPPHQTGRVKDADVRAAHNELADEVGADRLARHGKHEAGGQNVDGGDGDGDEQRPDGQARVVDLDHDHAKHERREEHARVPPVRRLGVVAHELGVHVVLLGAHAHDALLERLAVVEDGVGEHRGEHGEAGGVDERERGRKVERRVGLVGVLVEVDAVGDDARDVVGHAEAVPGGAAVEGQVGLVPDVLKVHERRDDPDEADKAGKDVALGPPGRDEGRADVDDLGPVKGEHREAEARGGAEHDVDGHVGGPDPADPVEEGEGGEEVAGHKVKDKGGDGDDAEEAEARHGAVCAVLLCVESVEDGGLDEVLGPDHARRPHEEAATHAGEAETDGLAAEHKEHVEAKGPRLAIVALVVLHDDDADRVGGVDGDAGHDGGECVLLDVVDARIEREILAAEPARERPYADGHDGGEELADGVGDEEDDGVCKGGCRVSHGEEHVGAGCDDGKEEGYEPHADGVDGHLGVVDVGDRGAHLGVGRVLLHLHLELHHAYAARSDVCALEGGVDEAVTLAEVVVVDHVEFVLVGVLVGVVGGVEGEFEVALWTATELGEGVGVGVDLCALTLALCGHGVVERDGAACGGANVACAVREGGAHVRVAAAAGGLGVDFGEGRAGGVVGAVVGGGAWLERLRGVGEQAVAVSGGGGGEVVDCELGGGRVSSVGVVLQIVEARMRCRCAAVGRTDGQVLSRDIDETALRVVHGAGGLVKVVGLVLVCGIGGGGGWY